MFSNVCLKDPRLFTSDHLLVLGVLPASPAHDHGRYLRSRRRFPLRHPQWGPQTRAWQSWISDETWRMVDETFRPPAASQP
jgi:hypothetical protein